MQAVLRGYRLLGVGSSACSTVQCFTIPFGQSPKFGRAARARTVRWSMSLGISALRTRSVVSS